jgi:hypothetical protein
LLASITATIYDMIIGRMNEKARKPLREIEIEITGSQGILAQNASTCACIPGYGASAKLPALRTFFQPPHPPVLPLDKS